MIASAMTAPSRLMRPASHRGTRPPCKGRSALPDLWAMRGPETCSDGLDAFKNVPASLTSATTMRTNLLAKDDRRLHKARGVKARVADQRRSLHPKPSSME